MNTKKFNNQLSDNKTRYKHNINSVAFYMIVTAILLFVAVNSVFADNKFIKANTTDHDQLFDLIPVGEGKYTWFGLSIYEASLWTLTGTFKDLNNTYPVALIIQYQKNIDSDELAKQTISEWEHLDIFDTKTRIYWGNRLAKIWPDVKPTDSITTLVTSDRKTLFYHNDSLLTQVDDTSLGTALLSIWLDSNTSEPDLRNELIGQKDNSDE